MFNLVLVLPFLGLEHLKIEIINKHVVEEQSTNEEIENINLMNDRVFVGIFQFMKLTIFELTGVKRSKVRISIRYIASESLELKLY
jgi:hypothetical protein